MAEYKAGLRKAGVKAPADVKPEPVKESRSYRKVPEERLQQGLEFPDMMWQHLCRRMTTGRSRENCQIHKVKILLSQHIGAPAQAVVKKGDRVLAGQMVAVPGNGLSVGIHASMDGVVQDVTDKYIIIGEAAR